MLRNLIYPHIITVRGCGGAGVCIESGKLFYKNKNAFTHSVIYLLRYLTVHSLAYGISSSLDGVKEDAFCLLEIPLSSARGWQQSDALKRRDMRLCDNKSTNMRSRGACGEEKCFLSRIMAIRLLLESSVYETRAECEK